MDAKQNLYELQMESIRLFKAQDTDAGDFDVTFLIDGKKLYAHKHRLTSVSPTFRSMLSERWTSKDAPIEIKDYSFENFKEFVLFIYSGSCSLTEANIFTMVDIAEFYGVGIFKNECDKYISKMQINLQNFLQFIELSEKYSLTNTKGSLMSYVSSNLGTFIKSEQFQSLQKGVMKSVVQSNQDSLRPEELFKRVYYWAEKRVAEKQLENGYLNLNEEIKKELDEFLPFIKFQSMDFDYVVKFVVKKSFLFSGDHLSDILVGACGKVYVKIFDENGNIMKGLLNCPDMEKVCKAIQLQESSLCINSISGFYWSTKQPVPTTSSNLVRNEKVQWYLVYNEIGNLYIERQATLDDSCYLLAEMTAEPGFRRSNKCKIRVYRCP